MALPVLGWREVLEALAKKDFRPVRQRGSHVVVENASGRFLAMMKSGRGPSMRFWKKPA